jgi:hypothetical protein
MYEHAYLFFAAADPRFGFAALIGAFFTSGAHGHRSQPSLEAVSIMKDEVKARLAAASLDWTLSR